MLDREKARERAVKARNKIMAARDALRETDDPKAETYQDEQLLIATDLIAALSEAPAPALGGISQAQWDKLEASHASLQKRLVQLGTMAAGLTDMLQGYLPPEGEREFSSFLLVVPECKLEPDRVQRAVEGAIAPITDPRQAVVPRSIEITPEEAALPQGASKPAADAAPAKDRAPEIEIPIETWNPSNDDLAKLPYQRAWVLGELDRFKVANKGKAFKRPMVAFRSHLSSAMARTPGPHAATPG